MGSLEISIDDETKERWKNEVEEMPEFRSVSAFIAFAVEQQLGDGSSEGGVDDEFVRNVITMISDVQEDIQDVERKVSDRLDTIERRIKTGDAAKQRMAMELHESLPEAYSTEAIRRIPVIEPWGYSGAAPNTPEEVVELSGAVKAAVDLLQHTRGVSESEARDAIDLLVQTMSNVRRTPDGEGHERIYIHRGPPSGPDHEAVDRVQKERRQAEDIADQLDEHRDYDAVDENE